MTKKVLLFCFFAGTANAANFPTGAQIEPITDFSGGLNTASPANKIAKSFSPNMRNVFIHRQPGKIIKRNGIDQVGITTNVLTSGRFMTIFFKEDGGKEYIVSDDSIVLTTQDFNTYVQISTALNQGAHLQSKQIRNKIWFTNGSESVFTWDGTVMQKLNGLGGTPNVPKFKFLEYYQERVFGFNTSANGSSLNWSDVASTAGAAVAPDSYLAWPVTNGLNIGQGDGQVGTSLWTSNGQLQIGKERSIYTLYGTNTSNYTTRRTESWVGPSSQDAVVVLDDITYFKGLDGIYAYDGGKAERISDPISPDVAVMKDVQTRVVVNVWDTPGVFDTGQYDQTISSASNVVKLFKGRTVLTGNSAQLRSFSPLTEGYTVGNFDPVTTSYYTICDFTTENQWLTSENFVHVQKVRVPMDTGGAPLATPARIRATLTNKFTGVFQTTVASVNNPASSYVDFVFSSHSFTFSGSHIRQSSMSLNLEWENKSDLTSQGARVFSPEQVGPSSVNSWAWYLAGETTGQYLSNVATNTAITAWQAFEASNNTNGGTINYFIRSSTSVINITTQTWQSISPGVVIPFSTLNLFVQWASTLTASVAFSGEPELTSVRINHTEGTASKDRPFAVAWNKEYWLSVATETSGNFSLQYVKSWITNPNPHAWMPMNGMNLRSFVADGNNALYGGAASTGAFYRLDYGTNDDGSAIDGFYETPDLTLRGAFSNGYAEGNWQNKQLHEIWIDVDAESDNTFRLGLSINGGSYSEQTRDVTGSARQLEIFYNQTKFAKYFRLRFRNNQIDKGLNLNNAAIIYQPLNTR